MCYFRNEQTFYYSDFSNGGDVSRCNSANLVEHFHIMAQYNIYIQIKVEEGRLLLEKTL